MIGRLGLDEIAIKKGHRDFVTIVTGRLENDQIVILGVLPDRKKDTVITFLRSIPIGLVKTIDTVCCDMYESYTEAVREELPNANIVIDRFHITQYYSKAAEELREFIRERVSPETQALLADTDELTTRAQIYMSDIEAYTADLDGLCRMTAQFFVDQSSLLDGEA